MTKTHRIETIEEYDADGKLVRKTTTEENTEEDSSVTTIASPLSPYISYLDRGTNVAYTTTVTADTNITTDDATSNSEIPGQMNMDGWATTSV
jgi:hypothetical protein